ncbi:hypothetical protein [Streptomyces sp. NPDC086835]|uniref:hypothetical protein n=1 Tax=Streptomyces sp. NPDC086835 TaxID=3365761 RepID=UPI00381D6D7D
MDGELITASAAVAVSVVGAGYAGWQAHIASRAARSAEAQARSAEAQARSAEEQARAAEEQVALMRRQLEADEAARHEAGGPNFSLSFDRSRHNPTLQQRVAVLKLKQEDGPALEFVRISVSGTGVAGLLITLGRIGEPDAEQDLGPMAQGAVKDVHVVLEHSAPDDGATARLSIRCDAGTGAPWRRDYSCDIYRRRSFGGAYGL